MSRHSEVGIMTDDKIQLTFDETKVVEYVKKQNGNPVIISEIADECGMTNAEVDAILNKLNNAGVLSIPNPFLNKNTTYEELLAAFKTADDPGIKSLTEDELKIFSYMYFLYRTEGKKTPDPVQISKFLNMPVPDVMKALKVIEAT